MAHVSIKTPTGRRTCFKIGGVVGACMDQAGDRMPAHPAKRMLVAYASHHVATIEDPIDLRSVQRRD